MTTASRGLTVTALSKRFDGVAAITDFSLTAISGSVIGLIGPNGAGKTTVFNLISGFLLPDAGDIRWNGIPLLGMPPHRIARSGIARLFQDLRLVRQLSVLDNILLALPGLHGEKFWSALLRGRRQPDRTAALDRADAFLRRLGLWDSRAHLADDLSYGQQKLLALGMCMASDAELYLLDEPIAGISSGMAEAVLALIRELRGAGKIVIVIEHNLGALQSIADRLVVMAGGRVIADGAPSAVLDDPGVLSAYLVRAPHA